ncbi:MAG: hypothetical protein WAM58_18485 [Candidatus Acidiferrum sp.]
MDKVPFSVYDFFAYLSSGSILLATFDYIFGFGLLSQAKIAPLFAVLLVVLPYVCGHIAAHFSSFLYEHLTVARFLKRPNGHAYGRLSQMATAAPIAETKLGSTCGRDPVRLKVVAKACFYIVMR